MAVNLLTTPWIPVASSRGERNWSTPAQCITAASGARIAWPRADFSGVTYEFLIGLLSVALDPKSDLEWWKLWKSPPELKQIEAAFSRLEKDFTLDGEERRVLQDVTAKTGKCVGISSLLIDSPGENTLKSNKDIFVKRDSVQGLCPRCAAMALLTLQTYAPSGGQGHRTSLRGGGPLTTLAVVDGDLWRTLWANVMTRKELEGDPIRSEMPDAPGPIFPWVAPLRVSEDDNSETHPHQAPWFQTFFGQPRRIWLDFDTVSSGTCDVCGEESNTLISRAFTLPRGVNYAGGWMHSLSPWSAEVGKPETIAARKGTPQGPGWRDWLGMVESVEESGGKGRQRYPAPAIRALRQRFKKESDYPDRIWAFGYDTDNMKARGWNTAEIPLLPDLDPSVSRFFSKTIQSLIESADEALSALVYALKRAHTTRLAEFRGDFNAEQVEFLSLVQDQFYQNLDSLFRQAQAGVILDSDATLEVRTTWFTKMVSFAERIYLRATEVLPRDFYDMRELSEPVPMEERRGPLTGLIYLRNSFYSRKSKIRAALSLPIEKDATVKEELK